MSMKKRKVSNWLDGYLEYVDNTEPPTSFHTWTALSVLASTLRRKVYAQWDFRKFYPNFFIILVAPAGRARKGTAMRVGEQFLKSLGKGITLIPQSITREALIRRMQNSTQTYTTPKGVTLDSSVTIFSEELQVFLRSKKGNADFLANLTDWYDCQDLWEYETTGRGLESISGVCLNMLGAAAPDWIPLMLPQEAIGGGFTSRIIFVVEQDKRKSVPSHTPTDRERLLFKLLKEDLAAIAKIRGEVKYSPEVKERYVEWYLQMDADIASGSLVIPDRRLTSYYERRPTHVLKLSALMSISRNSELIVELEDFERALELLTSTEERMPQVFSGVGQSDDTQTMEQIIRWLQKKKQATQHELLTYFYHDLDIAKWDRMKELLVRMKKVKIIVDFEAGTESYQWLTLPKPH